jgi:lauroyl/myristoyl acyltransferase
MMTRRIRGVGHPPRLPSWARWLLVSAIERAPPVIAYPAASVLGHLVWYCSPRRRVLHRRRARFAIDGGSSERVELVARGSWLSTVLHYLDAVRLGRPSSPRGAIGGEQHVRRAREAGRGVVLATPHLGAPELGLLLLRDAGLDLMVMGARGSPRSVGSVRGLMRGGRRRSGFRILEPDLSGLRAASSHLRRGGIVAIFADVDAPGTGVEVDFLSHRASLPTLPVALALRTNAALIAVSALRLGSITECIVTLEPALELPQVGDRQERLQLGTELLARAMAKCVRAAPEQWYREARWAPSQTDDPHGNGRTTSTARAAATR